MADQSVLQEAIKRARELAARMPAKRPASDLDSIGDVKVTLAYQGSAKPGVGAGSANAHTNKINDEKLLPNNDRMLPPRGAHEKSLLTGSNAFPRGSEDKLLNPANAYPRGGGGGPVAVSEERIEIIIPHAVIGLVIGKGGENIKRIQSETGATVRVDPNTVDEKGNKVCTITGTKQAVDDAHSQVASVIENSSTNKRPRLQVDGGDSYRMKIPASRTGAIIGKGGETIKQIKQQSGCDIELDKTAKESIPDESVFIIRGTQEKISKARALIEARLANRGRDGDPSGRTNSSVKGVATGANAAPVAQYTDLTATYPATQGSADVQAAWSAYYAQYNTLINQPQPQPQAPQAPQNTVSQQPQQDYSEQWIQYYIASGRPDYAAQIIEMKKQQQDQQAPTNQ